MTDKNHQKLFIFDHASYLPNGSSPQRHYALARELLGMGIKTTLIGSGFDHRSGRNIKFDGLSLWKSQIVDEVRYVWLRLPVYKGFKARVLNMIFYPLLAILCFLSGYLGRPKCVVGSSPHLFAALGANAVAFLAGTRFVLEIRDLWPDSAVDVLGLNRKNPFVFAMRVVEKHLFCSADRVISVLPGIARYVNDKKFPIKRHPVWIPNGVDLGNFPATISYASRVEGQVVYFGAIGPANKLDMLLRIWVEIEKISSHMSLQIIGDGPSLPGIVSQCRELGLKRVKFLGFCKDKCELYSIASKASAFVLAVPVRRIYEYGVSMNKIPEYLALGRPLIYLGYGLDENLGSKPFALAINDADDQKTACRIVEFVAHAAGQEGMMKDARLLAEQMYSYTSLAKHFYQACMDCVPIKS
ncbi:glycosyltransferase family 4 protein [Polaromonas hydrogenivorans]|uniref:Glycosyltransferase family 4 protein n=1 Tax=Polaromonas hydrogenivorans TaxID=335476 RepID=A0AAU7LU47_9BURK